MRYLVLILLLAGCAETRTQEEIEWSHAMARENWALCETVYVNAGKPTFHRGHTHGRGATRERIEWTRQDLADNHCRQVLGSYWAE